MDKRVIRILDAADFPVAEIDISHVHHANSMAPMTLIVQTRCDLGHWHEGQKVTLDPWGLAVNPRNRRA